MDNPSFMFFPKDFIARTWWMDAKEVGEYFLETMALFNSKKYDELSERIGIGRIYVGTAKRKSIPPSIRRKVLSVGYCAFCYSTTKLTIDHIIPVSKGGLDDIENLQCLCFPCNRAKSNKL